MFNWFSSSESVQFGKELATFVLAELKTSSLKNQDKFDARAERALVRADRRLQEFKAREHLNVYKKAKLANAFLWTLRERGCGDEATTQLTRWLSAKM